MRLKWKIFVASAVLCTAFLASGCDQRATKVEQPAAVTPPSESATLTSSNAASAAPTSLAASGPALFTDVTAQLGLPAPAPYPDGTYALPELPVGCVALIDPKNEGRLSLLLVAHPPPGREEFKQTAPNRLFRQTPDGKFVEVPDAAGLQGPGYHYGVAVGDYDNDGFADVLITNFGAPDLLFHNNGDGTFSNVTAKAGLPTSPDPLHYATAAAFVDLDGDGYLDLVIAHYAECDKFDPCKSTVNEEISDYCGPHRYPGQMPRVYHNNRNGTFTDITESAGMATPAHGLGLIAADLFGTGRPDIFQTDDREPNQCWINQGNLKFVDEGLLRGCALSASGIPAANMGVAVGDIFNHGQFDILVTHMTNESNVLFRGNGDGTFTDWTAQAGMSARDRRETGWGAGFFDYDNDGNLDMASANGRITRGAVLRGTTLSGFWSRYAEPNLLFRGDGEGHFTDVSDQATAFTGRIEVHHALAFGDLWNRGAIDLVEVNIDNSIHVFRNDAAPRSGNHWLQVLPMTGKREALGARVRLSAGGKTHLGLCLRSYSFLASNDPRVHFGLGKSDKVESLEIEWPSGSPRREKFQVTRVDRVLTIAQGAGVAE